MLFRYATATLLGAVATFGLLALMRSVIADPMPAEDDGIKGDVLGWARLVEEREFIKKTEPPEPPPPPERPPEPPPPDPYYTGPTGPTEWFPEEPDIPNIKDGFGNYIDDGTYLPIVKVRPIYPRRALTRNIEGYVLVEFVVTASGGVRDPVVLVADPPGFFERAALNAVLKFKYKPMVVNSKPVEVAGVRNRIVFEMADE